MQIQSLNIFSLNSNPFVSFGSSARYTDSLQYKTDSFEKTNYVTPLLSRRTFEKARNIVMKSLLDKDPKESIVLIRNDKILFFAKGDEFEAEIPDEIMDDILSSGDGDIIIVHSHTPEKTGLTAPLSMADVGNLIDCDKITTVCAINNKGEYSIIERMPDRYYDDTLCDTMDEKCRAGFVNLFSGSKKREYTEFLKSLNNVSDMQPGETPEEFLDRMLLVEDSLDEYYDFAASLKDFPKYMEDFWKNNAKELGFNYYSNFSF